MFGNPILELVFRSWSIYALFAVSRLSIFTLLEPGGMTAEQLAQRAGATPRNITVLLDACVAMGLLRVKDGLYSNSHFSDAYLVKGRLSTWET